MNNIVKEIHSNNNCKIVLTITGGGFSAFSELMSQPGASNTVLQLYGPYSQEATTCFVGKEIKQFVSQEMADELALVSLQKCREFYTMSKTSIIELEEIENCYGIGVTCALASKVWKKGDHRCYITIMSNNIKHNFYLNLHKGTEDSMHRSRNEEDMLCGSLIIKAIAHAIGIIDINNIVKSIDNVDQFTYNFQNFNNSDIIDRLINPQLFVDENIDSILCLPTGKRLINVPIHKLKLVMVPGSFNPLHSGHKFLMEKGLELGNTNNGIYELCVYNVDKPPLSKEEILKRLYQFTDPVILTNTPTFIKKAKLFPGISYSIGIDTALRLVDPFYYTNNKKEMIRNILKIGYESTKFFVGERALNVCNLNERYKLSSELYETLTLTNIIENIDPLIRDYFIEIKNNMYKDISSSFLRKND